MRRPFTIETGSNLWRFIAHGSVDHKIWLAEAIEAFRLGKERPEPRG